MIPVSTTATHSSHGGAQDSVPPEELYLTLLQKCLTAYLERDILRPVRPHSSNKLSVIYYRFVKRVLDAQRLVLARREPFDEEYAINGGPSLNRYTNAQTMIGMNRLEQLRQFIRDVMQHQVPGDLIETGVWRGGATIFMRAVLKAYGDTTRSVWVADSFAGLPPPDLQRYPQDRGSDFHTQQHMIVSLDEVKASLLEAGYPDTEVADMLEAMSELPQYAGRGIQKSQ